MPFVEEPSQMAAIYRMRRWVLLPLSSSSVSGCQMERKYGTFEGGGTFSNLKTKIFNQTNFKDSPHLASSGCDQSNSQEERKKKRPIPVTPIQNRKINAEREFIVAQTLCHATGFCKSIQIRSVFSLLLLPVAIAITVSVYLCHHFHFTYISSSFFFFIRNGKNERCRSIFSHVQRRTGGF